MLSSFIQYQNALQTLRLLSPAIPFLVLNLVKSPPFTPNDGAWLQQEVVEFIVNAPWLPPPLFHYLPLDMGWPCLHRACRTIVRRSCLRSSGLKLLDFKMSTLADAAPQSNHSSDNYNGVPLCQTRYGDPSLLSLMARRTRSLVL